MPPGAAALAPHKASSARADQARTAPPEQGQHRSALHGSPPRQHPSVLGWPDEAAHAPAGRHAGASPCCARAPLMRKVPSSGEALPLVGLGTWITFNVATTHRRAQCVQVLRLLRRRRPAGVDSSPSTAPRKGWWVKACAARAGWCWPPTGLDRRRRRRQVEPRAGSGRCRASTCCGSTTWSPGKSSCRCCGHEGARAAARMWASPPPRKGGGIANSSRSCAATLDFVQFTYNIADRLGQAAPAAAAAERGTAVLARLRPSGGRTAAPAAAPSAAGMGRGDRLRRVWAPVRAEVHREPPGGDLRHPGHPADRPRAGEPRRQRPDAGRVHAPAHGRTCAGL